MDKSEWAAFSFLQEASDEDWMCFARFYLDGFHGDLALWMVNQRRCPEAVALALFWYSHPEVCSEYRKRGSIPYYHGVLYTVFMTVEKYFKTGFYSESSIGFNPENDISDPVKDGSGRNWYFDPLNNRVVDVLEKMMQSVDGRIVNVQSVTEDWIEGLPPNVAHFVFDMP